MAVKKSELYSSLWKSCDELRGGMDASQYKDYVLVLLFIKYISDKAKAGQTLLNVPPDGSFDDLLQWRNKPTIGDETNKVIGRLATANDLQGVIDLADFNDPDKLGRGKDMVERLTNLINIFNKPELDFGANAAEGDDLLGDAYEYLMRHFATESGKAKGQFYTPAEVSRVMASVIGVGSAASTDQTIYDPTCGSGSLLLRAHAQALETTGLDLAIYGQEMDNATAALAKMNMILHGVESAVIWQDNTLSQPHFKNSAGGLETFDFLVANPPFSTKSWSTGVDTGNDPYGRFKYGTPPPKNGDFAFLLHMLASLKSTGKAAVILPHGVLFRGNAEANIRRELIKRGFIKAVIGLPPNLFYGTGIPAVIIILDKEDAGTSTSVFMMDASKGFVKEGPKNRLRERDIHRIVDTFESQADVPGYSRAVPLSEIVDPRNDCNLNILRYITPAERADEQNLVAHLRGGIPVTDIDALAAHWAALPGLREGLFSDGPTAGYVALRVAEADVASTIENHPSVKQFNASVAEATRDCVLVAAPRLAALDADSAPKQLLRELSESILDTFRVLPLLDPYAVFQAFVTYWQDQLADDAYLVCELGWAGAAAPAEVDGTVGDFDFTVLTKVKGKNGKERKSSLKMRSQVLPRWVLVHRYFSDEESAAALASAELSAASAAVDELLEEHGSEDGYLASDSGKLSRADAARALVEAKRDAERSDEAKVLEDYVAALDAETAAKRAVKTADDIINSRLAAKYAALSTDEIRELLVSEKWMKRFESDIEELVVEVRQSLEYRLRMLSDRYRTPLPQLTARTVELRSAVEGHLRDMGLTW